MAIVQTLDKHSFIDAFMQSSRKDQFSYEALEAIFDYLEEYSNETGEPVELDIIAICCDWEEMTWQEIAQSYNVDLSACDSEIDKINAVEDFLMDETVGVCHVNNDSFVFVQF